MVIICDVYLLYPLTNANFACILGILYTYIREKMYIEIKE